MLCFIITVPVETINMLLIFDIIIMADFICETPVRYTGCPIFMTMERLFFLRYIIIYMVYVFCFRLATGSGSV